MKYNSVDEFIYVCIMLMGICSAIIGLYILVFAIRAKTKPVDCFEIIVFKQRLIVSVCSTLLWGILPIWLATVLWVCIFLVFRCLVFRTDELRLEELYRKYDNSPQKYPPIKHIKECKAAFFPTTLVTAGDTQFRYSFREYILSVSGLLLLVCLGITTVSQTCVVIYNIEFLIVATAVYVFIGKFIYHIALNSPTSLFYLSPTLACLPVIIGGIVYYFVCIVILLTTSTSMQL